MIEYLTTMGIKGTEIAILGPNSVTWRGATYTAVPVPVAVEAQAA